ncbi:MAG TPA: bifunctional DNA-binding transcriptional regulator/O6-methylguanine-DNA methyltransferase Ada [Acidobacteriota bacterium]|nr:bifunctional DNA-binding transcriptional regulator/O6-methylguanine-DNA methyltransferase Ada [Acidobacteriota bacterium]
MELAKVQDFDTQFWNAIVHRDASMDGQFVFAVTTTGVFCRPSCPARRPLHKNVHFFESMADAVRAGYRACLRCRPDQTNIHTERQLLAERAWKLLKEDSQSDRALGLNELAERLDVSVFQLHRAFKETYGLTPKQFQEAQRISRFKDQVRNSKTVTDALYEVGYGSSSRLYEKSSSMLGMTPASYRKGGKGARIRYSIRDCEFGLLLTAATDRGVCAVRFGEKETQLLKELKDEFPEAQLVRDDSSLENWSTVVNDFVHAKNNDQALPLDIQASAFQLKVWNYLRSLSPGQTKTYGDVAREIGRPTASRAVARACATNPVAVVIPCHRVVPSSGGTGGYRWGADRKKRILEFEKRGFHQKDTKPQR